MDGGGLEGREEMGVDSRGEEGGGEWRQGGEGVGEADTCACGAAGCG